jgi:hypothetical protein
MDMETIASLDCKKLAAPCLRHMDGCLPRIDFLIDRMEPVIEEYGRMQGMHSYRYFIYYDIVDSTATHAARRGGDSENHEQRVEGLKRVINKAMESMAINARKHRGEVYCTNGNTESDNDCKHIFISGRMARRYVGECIYRLLYLTDSFPGINVRMYAVPCDFVNSKAYRQQNSEEVRGKRFWTNWSRLLEAGKAFEDVIGNGTSFLLIGGETLYNSVDLSFAQWLQPVDAIVEPELGGGFRRVAVRYGALSMPRLSHTVQVPLHDVAQTRHQN